MTRLGLPNRGDTRTDGHAGIRKIGISNISYIMFSTRLVLFMVNNVFLSVFLQDRRFQFEMTN